MKQNANFLTKKEKKAMLNRISNWDFNPQQLSFGYLEYKPDMLILNPIPLMANDGVSMTSIHDVIKKNKKRGLDVLNNGSYPIFDADSRMILCGNRSVAFSLVNAGMARLSNKAVKYPVYYSGSSE